MSYNKQILQLEVGHYDITKDGTTLIEISIHNYKEIIKKEEDEYSLASLFSKQTYLLDTLLLTIYSKVYKQRTENSPSFFLPIDFSCSEDCFQQIKEFVENAGFNDSIKFTFNNEESLEHSSFTYNLEDKKSMVDKGLLEVLESSKTSEETCFTVNAVVFSTPIPDEEMYPEGIDKEEILDVEPTTHTVAIPYIIFY